jgi:hypothetical protein
VKKFGDISKSRLSYSNILTPCSTQKNIDFPNFLSKRNFGQNQFNSPVNGYIPTTSKISDEQFPSFFSGEEIYGSREDIEKEKAKPLGFNVSSISKNNKKCGTKT